MQYRLYLGLPYYSLPEPARLSTEETREKFIDMLWFRQMSVRQDGLAVAHHDTFKWILADVTRPRRPVAFDPLLPWLQHGNGAYWFNGKAGSGKSTLVKFLGSDAAVRSTIQGCADPKQLIVASLYFWRSGTLLQNSQEGLLRWLLYTILSQRPELVRTCFPEGFSKLQAGRTAIHEIVPTLKVLTRALNHLSGAALSDIKVFLFIDGLDEFEGDHTHISMFFRDLAVTSRFKVLISSRAIQACVEAFKDLPGLRLQDSHGSRQTRSACLFGSTVLQHPERAGAIHGSKACRA